jgi:hypothetical protein
MAAPDGDRFGQRRYRVGVGHGAGLSAFGHRHWYATRDDTAVQLVDGAGAVPVGAVVGVVTVGAGDPDGVPPGGAASAGARGGQHHDGGEQDLDCQGGAIPSPVSTWDPWSRRAGHG